MDKTILLKSAEKILRAIFADQKVNNLKRFCKKADSIFGKFIVGKAIDSLIIGGICFIGLIILKIRYPLLISIIVVVTNMIPYFGPIIGAAIAFVITSFYNPIQGLWVLIFVFLLQQFDGMILGPAILGDKVGVRPLWIIFSVALGGSLFGVIGMFLGVPAIATIRVLIVYFVNRKWKKKKIKFKNELDRIEGHRYIIGAFNLRMVMIKRIR
jgi:predicted PurR-regulated permease PerM